MSHRYKREPILKTLVIAVIFVFGLLCFPLCIYWSYRLVITWSSAPLHTKIPLVIGLPLFVPISFISILIPWGRNRVVSRVIDRVSESLLFLDGLMPWLTPHMLAWLLNLSLFLFPLEPLVNIVRSYPYFSLSTVLYLSYVTLLLLYTRFVYRIIQILYLKLNQSPPTRDSVRRAPYVLSALMYVLATIDSFGDLKWFVGNQALSELMHIAKEVLITFVAFDTALEIKPSRLLTKREPG